MTINETNAYYREGQQLSARANAIKSTPVTTLDDIDFEETETIAIPVVLES